MSDRLWSGMAGLLRCIPCICTRWPSKFSGAGAGTKKLFFPVCGEKKVVFDRMAPQEKGNGEGEPEGEHEDEEEYPVPQCPLHEAVAVQPSPMGGRGLFALRDFAAGDGELALRCASGP